MDNMQLVCWIWERWYPCCTAIDAQARSTCMWTSELVFVHRLLGCSPPLNHICGVIAFWRPQVCGKIFLGFWSSHSGAHLETTREIANLWSKLLPFHVLLGHPIFSTVICQKKTLFWKIKSQNGKCCTNNWNVFEEFGPTVNIWFKRQMTFFDLVDSWHLQRWRTGLCDWPMTGLSYAQWLPLHTETFRSIGQRRPGTLVCHLPKGIFFHLKNM